MLQKIIFLLFAVVVGLPLNTKGQRNIVWVHGLNTSLQDWTNFSNQFTGLSGSHQFNQSTPLTYTSSDGLQVFANQITSKNPAGIFNSSTRPIAVGHSMGGAALRRLDFTTNVGGIIAVGAPLDGAGVATAVNSGEGTAQIHNGVNQVSRGPISELAILPSVLGIRVSSVIEALIAHGVFTNDPLAFNPSTFGEASVNDLQINGGITADMNNTPTARPKISIFGNLSSPVQWKMATAAVNFSNQAPAFLKGVDLSDAASRAEDIYNVIYIVHTSLAVSFTVGGFFNPIAWFAAAYEFWKANEWQAGRDWFRDSERIWNVIIGANLPSVQTQCFSYNAFVCSYSNNANFMNPSCWQPVTTCIWTVLTGKSDGFIPAGSQAGFNSPSWDGAARVEAFDVSHFQEFDVNNAVMQQRFAEVWNGNHGPYFLTLPR